MKKQGFTIIEFLIVLATLGIVLAFILAWALPLMTGEKQKANAEELARKWAAVMYPGAKPAVICQGTDSDGDSYVSCTVKIGEERLPIECHHYIWFSSGNTCRERTPSLKVK